MFSTLYLSAVDFSSYVRNYILYYALAPAPAHRRSRVGQPTRVSRVVCYENNCAGLGQASWGLAGDVFFSHGPLPQAPLLSFCDRDDHHIVWSLWWIDFESFGLHSLLSSRDGLSHLNWYDESVLVCSYLPVQSFGNDDVSTPSLLPDDAPEEIPDASAKDNNARV